MAKKTKSRRTKLLSKQHTGKLRPHKHTSYGSLALILFVAFMPLIVVSHSASADTSGGGTYQTDAVVVAPVSKTPPSVSNLTNGKVYSTAGPISVQGQCPNSTLVEVFKNQVMAGAELCQNGVFNISIDLFTGTNSLIVRAYNANGVAGPDSVPVTVESLPPGVSLQSTGQLNALGAPANQFYLTAEVYYRGAEAGSDMSWPLTVAGGQAPYAISVGWGDGKTSLISRGAAGQFTIDHVYAHANSNRGNYPIVIKATDQTGDTSYLQLVAIVSGNASTGIAGVVGGGYNSSGTIKAAWQLLAVATVVVASFWIGERREVRMLRHRAGRTA